MVETEKAAWPKIGKIHRLGNLNHRCPVGGITFMTIENNKVVKKRTFLEEGALVLLVGQHDITSLDASLAWSESLKLQAQRASLGAVFVDSTSREDCQKIRKQAEKHFLQYKFLPGYSFLTSSCVLFWIGLHDMKYFEEASVADCKTT